MKTRIHHARAGRILVASLAATFGLAAAHAASVSISGTVKDAGGKAIGGADVYSVTDPKVKTTSAADGSFSLAGDVAASPAQTRAPVAAAKAGYLTAQILSPGLATKDLPFKLYPAIVGTSVTLMGIRMNHSHARYDPDWEKNKFSFILAFDGPPGIQAEADQIWADYHPGPSLDADAALELENQFRQRLLFYVDGPLVDAKFIRANNYGMGTLTSITGTIREEGGKQYITATATGAYKGPTYPARIKGVAQPLVNLPVKAGLGLKLTETLSDTLIYVPPGRFYMGCPLEQYPHWQEAPQHMVTLAKGFYMSDHPILNSEYAAATGDAACNPKNHPDGAAANLSCEMFQKYVKALAKLNPGKAIRPPTRAEWEYAARCGASSLSWSADSSSGRYGETGDRTKVLKSLKPNAWGFFGLVFDDGSERTLDAGFYSDQVFIPPVTDPRYPMRECLTDPAKEHIHANSGKGGRHPIQELFNDQSNVGKELGGKQRNEYAIIRQRIVVEE